MPTDEQWANGSFDEDSGGGWADEGGSLGPKKKGMSTAMIVVIILGCIAGGGFLLCCGGAFWLMKSTQATMDPQEVIAITKEIVEIEIPDVFQPNMGFDVNIFGAFKEKIAWYESKSGEGLLILMSLEIAAAGDQAVEEAQMQQQLQQLQQQRQGDPNLRIKKSESREFEVRGEKVDFNFAETENMDNGDPWRQVTGTFAGKAGTVMLMLKIEEEAYDEDVVIKMIESIK